MIRGLGAFVVGVGLIACTGTDGATTGETGTLERSTIPPDRQVDVRVQLGLPEIDVLLVVDTSGAVSKAQQASFFSSFESFVDYFSEAGVSYHVGWITTDMEASTEAGALQGNQRDAFVDNARPDPLGAFEALAQPRVGGADARPIDAVFTALQLLSEGANRGFRRTEADLHIALLLGGDDSSTLLTAEEFVEWHELYTADTRALSMSLVSDAVVPPFDALNKAQGGFTLGLDQPLDWNAQLRGLDVAATPFNFEFLLSRRPIPESIGVEVLEGGADDSSPVGFDTGSDYSYDPVRNSILFSDYWPPVGANVRISYTPINGNRR